MLWRDLTEVLSTLWLSILLDKQSCLGRGSNPGLRSWQCRYEASTLFKELASQIFDHFGTSALCSAFEFFSWDSSAIFFGTGRTALQNIYGTGTAVIFADFRVAVWEVPVSRAHNLSQLSRLFVQDRPLCPALRLPTAFSSSRSIPVPAAAILLLPPPLRSEGLTADSG